MWDNVPWMVGGGVQHSVEVCRLLSYVASGGREGIVGSKDLQVTAQPSPAASVRVWPGACGIIDREQTVQYGSYTAQKIAQETVPIAPAGAGGRSDLVVAQIINPYRAGSPWPDPGGDPAARQAYQYVRTFVISGVPNTTKTVKSLGLGYTALALARIDLPANAATVLQGYITDLRKMLSSSVEEISHVSRPAADRTLTSATYANWPSDANKTVEVPEWATHVNLKAMLGGVQFGPGSATDNLRLLLHDTTVVTPATPYDVSVETGKDRTTLMAAGTDLAIPASWRGTNRQLRLEGQKLTGNTSLVATVATAVDLSAQFMTKPESNV